MNPYSHRLGLLAGRLAGGAFVPVAALTAYLVSRHYRVDATRFLVMDGLTVAGLVAALILALLAGFWHYECGEGWGDRLRCGIGCLPLAILISLLDPLGVANPKL